MITNHYIWVFPKIEVPPKMDGLYMFIMENPIKMDDLGGYHYFWKHPYIRIPIKQPVFHGIRIRSFFFPESFHFVTLVSYGKLVTELDVAARN